MRHFRSLLAVLVVSVLTAPPLRADDSKPAPDVLRAAISRSIPLLDIGSAGSAEQRTCFTCHNQAVPVLALVEAKKQGFAIDEENLERQLKHTAEHLVRGRKSYLEGSGQGGTVVTAGYALWTLDAGGWQADETTAAVAGFLLDYQKEANHWSRPGKRPPSSGSDFTTTYVALRGLAAFGTDEQRSRIELRTQEVGQWLLSEDPCDTEDRVFRLRAFEYVGEDPEVVSKAVEELLNTQRSDGGWAQTSEIESDAYATGTVLVALLRAGGLSAEHPAIRRGIAYLVDTQLDDGSWHVVTRAEPFQTYFESGFPHGKDQFISLTASSWSTLALLLSLPESP